MGVSARHVLQQLPTLGAMVRAGARDALRAVKRPPDEALPELPGPWITATLPPRQPLMTEVYARHVGADALRYEGRVPPHLFPQWTFPLQLEAMRSLPFPLGRMLNAGARLEVDEALPMNEPLQVATRLERVDASPSRVLVECLSETGTALRPAAQRARFRAILPRRGSGQPKSAIPDDARELARWTIPVDAGLDFAKLTGDFNPIHWVPSYAKAWGLANVILHGFSTLARTWEGLAHRLAMEPGLLDVRFEQPLVLPAQVGLFVRGDAQEGEVWVGQAPGAAPSMRGTYRARGRRPMTKPSE
ncbi:MAG: MaoC/PaaZ C-terminal domain-containing protein [Myxococcota bacterium]